MGTGKARSFIGENDYGSRGGPNWSQECLTINHNNNGFNQFDVEPKPVKMAEVTQVGELCADSDQDLTAPLLSLDAPLQSHSEILMRPIRVYDGIEWIPTNRGVTIPVDLTKDIMEPFLTTARNAGYSGVRFDIEATFEVIASIATGGIIRFSWQPTQDPSSIADQNVDSTVVGGKGFLVRRNMPGINSILPGVDFDINKQTTACLRIPWHLCQDYWPINAPSQCPPFARLTVTSVTMPCLPSGGVRPKIRLWVRPVNIKCIGSVAYPGKPTWTVAS